MIVLGTDHGGFELKEFIKQRLQQAGHRVEDIGAHSPAPVEYPDIAAKLAACVLELEKSGETPFGILFCGTGIGMSIAVNKVHGIRAALCGDCFSARMAKEHNNANVIAMGGRTLGRELAWQILTTYMNAEFQGGIHAPRVDTLNAL